MRFTIGYIDHDNEVYDKYLVPSLLKLKGDYDIIKTSDVNKPAVNYNKIIKDSPNRYIILTHQDISFSDGLLERIELSINEIKNFGVLGLVGVDEKRTYRWSSPDESFELETLDCCFIVIDKNNNVMFDETTFDDYHLYVEDFCLQTKKITGRSPYTLLIGKSPKLPYFLCHHSHTIRKLGSRWGKYNEYKSRLVKKWGDVKTT